MQGKVSSLLHYFTAYLPWLTPLLNWLAPGKYLPQFCLIRETLLGLIKERKGRLVSCCLVMCLKCSVIVQSMHMPAVFV